MTTQTLNDDRLAGVIAEFDRLGFLDLSKLHKLIADRDELGDRLFKARQSLLALRPSAKDFDQETARLAQLTNALQAQLDAARGDVAEEILRLKYLAATEYDLSDIQAKAKAILGEWIRLQVQAYDLLGELDATVNDYNETVGAIAGFAHDLRLEPPRPMTTVWGAGWPEASGVHRAHLDRFMRLFVGGRPTPGSELEWFGRRVF